MMNGELCIPVTLCQQQYPSKIIFFNSREHLHLAWRALQRRDNVNLTYSSSADTVYLCFANVNESFVIVEYCEVRRAQLCESGSIFCCNNWAEFVSRTSVNVAGGGSKLCPYSIMLIAVIWSSCLIYLCVQTGGGSLPTPCEFLPKSTYFWVGVWGRGDFNTIYVAMKTYLHQGNLHMFC